MADNKIAVVIYEPISGDTARVYRGLKTAAEFKAAGDDVTVAFDGSGVETLAAISDANHPMNPLIESLRENVRGACAFCAGSHKVKDEIADSGWGLRDEAGGELSIRALAGEGRQILNF
ncbi:DsrE family protein [Microbacterium aquimaris]|uniref:DsrE family protein n=1 Tax=Microbacterium aquimaris TaxID=459816 RepID=A0ABU5N2H8_9MICO|nr:DsrE family protein [Microbacterium aquimaris]MDZ8160247.1 DsrE family protein [Microbacterium aquimaris]